MNKPAEPIDAPLAELIGPDDDVPEQPPSYGLTVFNPAEIDQQVSTAKKYPRKLSGFQRSLMSMTTASPEVAASCLYSLPPRAGGDGKKIEGPSARFAEMAMHSWGNCRGGARVIDITDKHVVVQGAFHDLEANIAITLEIRRRITNKEGKRYSEDMIVTTGNAACAIVFRNAVLKGIPSSYWKPVYAQMRKVIEGKSEDLGGRVKAALDKLDKTYKVKAKRVFTTLEVSGKADIDVDKLVTLLGLITALEEGDITAEQAFGPKRKDAPDPATQDGSRVINDQEATLLDKALYKAARAGGPTIDELCRKFGIDAREKLPAAKLNEALSWIESGGGA